MHRNGSGTTKILAVFAAALLVLSQLLWLLPAFTFAETAGDVLVVRVQYYGEIGDKIREKASFTRSELEAMGASTYYYSNITRVGTVMSMAAYGPEVMTIIEEAGIDPASIGNVTFRTTDGYTRNFTVAGHLTATKYYYPNLSSLYERNEEGNALTPLEGALDGKEQVPAILALEFGESKEPGVYAEDLTMSTNKTYRFCMGQSDLEEGRMTNPDDSGGDISSMESCHSIYGIDVTLSGSPIHGIGLDLSDTSIKVGSMKRVSVSFDVDSEFEGAFSEEDLYWTSSDESIATVNDSGEVTIVGPGEVTITATAPDGTSASITINGLQDEETKEEEEEAAGEVVEKEDNEPDETTEEDPVEEPSDQTKEDDDKPDSEDETVPEEEEKEDIQEESDEQKPEEKDKTEDIVQAKEVGVKAHELILGDMVVEDASPQDKSRQKMAEDAQALDEARTYSEGAAAGTAAGAGLLCLSGSISRVIRYRKEF